MPERYFGERQDLIDDLMHGHGSIEQEEQWLARLKDIDPEAVSSGLMRHLEERVGEHRKLEDTVRELGKPSKGQLVELVGKLQRSEGTEDEQMGWLLLLDRNVPHPAISDLIYHSEGELTAEEIVEQALAYKPIQL
jgi:hypothetical protein